MACCASPLRPSSKRHLCILHMTLHRVTHNHAAPPRLQFLATTSWTGYRHKLAPTTQFPGTPAELLHRRRVRTLCPHHSTECYPRQILQVKGKRWICWRLQAFGKGECPGILLHWYCAVFSETMIHVRTRLCLSALLPAARSFSSDSILERCQSPCS